LRNIPFNRAAIVGNELEYITNAVDRMHISGDGEFTRKSQELIQQRLGVRKTFLTTSCTHALELMALALGITSGDEVIVPSFTFVSTVNAFVLRGARPVFADVRPDTLNIDETRLEPLITPRTRAIVVVHYAGVGCEMDAIQAIAARHGVAVLEDNAHGLFGKYRGQYLGTCGQLAAQSFHETKNVTCGEGGALLLNDPELVERIEIFREKGTNRTKFFRGQVDKYTWVDVGSSYLPSDILAAFLYAQLEHADDIQSARQHVWERYCTGLSAWAAAANVGIPVVPAHCEQSYHMFYLLLPSLEIRTSFIDYLRERGVMSVFHYQPLNTSAMGLQFGARAGDCPVTEDVSDRLVRLPFYNTLTDSDQEYVLDAITSFHC